MTECPECHGKGMLPCWDCKIAGSSTGISHHTEDLGETCKMCDGKRSVPCTKCGGTGKV